MAHCMMMTINHWYDTGLPGCKLHWHPNWLVNKKRLELIPGVSRIYINGNKSHLFHPYPQHLSLYTSYIHFTIIMPLPYCVC